MVSKQAALRAAVPAELREWVDNRLISAHIRIVRALTLGILLAGAVVIETVFALPGLGRYVVQGALNRDYPLVLGVVTLYAALIILFNLLADILYGWLDPRVRG